MGSVSLEGFGSGSNPLNFKVVGGTSAPANPKENTIWVNTSTKVTSWDFSASEPHRRSGNKNLLCYPFWQTTKTENGITFTDNKDGTIKANGTASGGNANFQCLNWYEGDYNLVLQPGTYTVSGCPSGLGENVVVSVYSIIGETSTYICTSQNGQSATFTLAKTTIIRVVCQILNGASVSNVVFKPQIEKGSVATSFVKGDATGQVWIETGTSSPVAFNALKKNGIEVYPISAYQYVNGAWVDKTAKSYQGGEWVDWIRDIYLYDKGNLCNDITGGYEVYKGEAGKVTWDTNYVQLTYSGSSYRSASICTKKTIDFTNAKELCCVLSNIKIDSGEGTFVAFGLCETPDSAINGSAYYSNLVAGKKITTSNASQTTYTLDISSVKGRYYFTIYAGIASVNMSQAYFKGLG